MRIRILNDKRCMNCERWAANSNCGWQQGECSKNHTTRWWDDGKSCDDYVVSKATKQRIRRAKIKAAKKES